MSAKIIYGQGKVGYDPRNSQMMKDIMKKKGVSEILNNPAEQKQVFEALKKEAGRGVLTRDGLRRVMGDLHKGVGEISREEGFKLGKIMAEGTNMNPFLARSKSSEPATKTGRSKDIPAAAKNVPAGQSAAAAEIKFKSGLEKNSQKFSSQLRNITPQASQPKKYF